MTRNEATGKIILHTQGDGALRHLGTCRVDRAEWAELLAAVKELRAYWGAELAVERSVSAALFNLRARIEQAAGACGLNLGGWSFLGEITSEVSRLFFSFPDGAKRPFLGRPESAGSQRVISEEDAIHRIWFHCEGSPGAFEVARRNLRYSAGDWEDLVSAVVALQQHWHGRTLVNRLAVAALHRLPEVVAWQAEYFADVKGRDDPDVPKLHELSQRLASEISALLKG